MQLTELQRIQLRRQIQKQELQVGAFALIIGIGLGIAFAFFFWCKHPDPSALPKQVVHHVGGRPIELDRKEEHHSSQSAIDTSWYVLHRYDGSRREDRFPEDDTRVKLMWLELTHWSEYSDEVRRLLDSERRSLIESFDARSMTIERLLMDIDPALKKKSKAYIQDALKDPKVQELLEFLKE